MRLNVPDARTCVREVNGAKARGRLIICAFNLFSSQVYAPELLDQGEPTVGSTVCSPHAFAGLACVAEFSADANAVVPFDFAPLIASMAGKLRQRMTQSTVVRALKGDRSSL